MCRVNRMDGSLEYEGVYTMATGAETIQDRDLSIDVDPTSDAMNWVRIDISHGAPLVFLRDRGVLIPQEFRSDAIKRLAAIETYRR